MSTEVIENRSAIDVSGIWERIASAFEPANVIRASVVGLTIIGLVFVYSASATVCADRYHNPLFFFNRALLFAGIGLIAMTIASKIDYRWYSQRPKLILFIAIIALALVLVPGIGHKVNGARRWFKIGPFNLQPSEFVKVAMVLYMSSLLSRKKDAVRSLLRGVLPTIIVIGIVFLLIAMQPDYGTAILISTTMFAMLFVSGMRLKHLGMMAGASLPLVVYMILYRAGYIVERVKAFLNPDLSDTGVNYQQNIALMAIGRGGLFGRGIGAGMMSKHYLPEAHNDFIFAIIAEETGLFGALTVVLLFGLIAISAWRAFRRATDDFAAFASLGLSFIIIAQAIINIAVATKSMPNKGIALPFISYGGSGMIASFIAIGILINIASSIAPRERGKNQKRTDGHE
ncbi:MAG: putative lipid II flippase FtsW [Planctomycetota bacterium]